MTDELLSVIREAIQLLNPTVLDDDLPDLEIDSEKWNDAIGFVKRQLDAMEAK
jgi:hypothetical protein